MLPVSLAHVLMYQRQERCKLLDSSCLWEDIFLMEERVSSEGMGYFKLSLWVIFTLKIRILKRSDTFQNSLLHFSMFQSL